MAEPGFSWGHVNINVSDLDRSIAFYQRLGFVEFLPGIPYLGLDAAPGAKAIPDPAAGALGLGAVRRGRACILQLGREGGFPKIDLIELDSPEAGAPLANADRGLVRLCLLCRDLEKSYRSLMAEGVEFLSPPQPGDKGMVTLATCVDPDGTLIELLEIHRDRWLRADRAKTDASSS